MGNLHYGFLFYTSYELQNEDQLSAKYYILNSYSLYANCAFTVL